MVNSPSATLEQDYGKNKVTEENAKSLQDKINVIENKLSKLYSDKVKGAQIRSRIKWVEEGEKKTQNSFWDLKRLDRQEKI
jgi:hypothetical protein